MATSKYNQGLINSKLNKTEIAILNLDAALQMNPNYFKARVLRGKCHVTSRNYENSISDLDIALMHQETDEAKNYPRKAKTALKQYAIRKNFYGILGSYLCPPIKPRELLELQPTVMDLVVCLCLCCFKHQILFVQNVIPFY